MGDNDMKQIDPSKDKLPKSARFYMQLLEQQNVERARRIALTRYKNRILGAVLASTVLSIYGYTMFATKQETFLDDFEEPLLVIDEPKK
ncbi:cytochrome c oxidase assembly factor 3, mitochondrial [Bemisia tabaci]|uniref:cytochrome c oxidase assembly factor 3, mitochondrial n=1 Tax=Bemisia tabaci TaxID=7038 RepID=UPI003B287EB9